MIYKNITLKSKDRATQVKSGAPEGFAVRI